MAMPRWRKPIDVRTRPPVLVERAEGISWSTCVGQSCRGLLLIDMKMAPYG